MPVLLFAVHHGEVALALRPQPLTSDASASGAVTAELSEINGYVLYATSELDPFAPATPAPSASARRTRPTTRPRVRDTLDMTAIPFGGNWFLAGIREARPFGFQS